MARERSEERCALTILWRIENITYWEPEFHGRSIRSTTFRPLCMDGTQFYLRVFPKGEEDDPYDDPDLQVQLAWIEKGIDYCIDCEWSLLDDVGSPLITETLNETTEYSKFLDMTDCPTHDEVFMTRKSSFLPHDTLTVRCRIWKSRKGLEHAEHISALTRINAAEKSFVWRIEKFSSLQLDQKVTTRVEISHFSDFLLNFSLMGASLEDARVNFQITTGKTEVLKLTINLSILKEEKDMKCVEGICAFRDGIREQTWDLPKFVSRKEILESRSDWLCGDDLTLRFNFAAVKKSIDGLIESSHCGPRNPKTDIPRHNPCIIINDRTVPKQLISQRKSNSTAVLLGDLLTMYKDQTLIDFNLRSGDVSFPVHKNVLSARSPVFRAMFCGDMREVDSSFQDIPDVDVHTLNRMLTFLYTGTVDDLQWEDAAKLYYAADKYQVLTLKQECTSLLQSGLSVSNVSDILELADRHQDQELASFVHDFLLNHYNEIVLSNEWDKFMERNGSFAGKTMKEVYKKKLQK